MELLKLLIDDPEPTETGQMLVLKVLLPQCIYKNCH